MAVILFRSCDSGSYADLFFSDIDRAVSSCYRKGDLINVKNDAWIDNPGFYQSKYWTKNVFVFVKCPQITVDQTKAYVQRWKRLLNFTILYSLHPVYEVRIEAVVSSQSQVEKLNRDKLKKYLQLQDADILNHGDNFVDVRFTLGSNESFPKLKAEVYDALLPVRKCQYRIAPEVVDTIVSQGRIIEVTKTQLLNYVTSKLDTIDGD